jgi:Glycosyltransferase family 87/WD40-like Beta Propeller Repeat
MVESDADDAMVLLREDEAIAWKDSDSAVLPGLGRWLRVGEWLLFALLATQFCVGMLPDAWKKLNTDFPNYYLTASLVHEGYDTSRVYEWAWIERQKDHRDLDQRIVGLVPITAFSTLMVYPLTSLPALAAKHWWIVFNFGLLLATLFLLRVMTHISWRRIALAVALSAPLRVNFMFGQYYVLLLFTLTLALYLYQRERRLLAGVMVGIAAGLKIFPVVYFLYFLRKKDWRALAGGVVGGAGAAAVSLLVFGWQLHRTYLLQVLPATLRGEGLDPYNLKAASLSSLLHRLFIYEPLLNPHPAVNAAWLFAVLHPVLQMAVVAPALLLAVPADRDARRVRLEWAAVMLASLAVSTSAAPYLFTLLLLPVCVVLEAVGRRSYFFVTGTLLVYVATGTLSGTDQGTEGWRALLAVPRLYAAVLFCWVVYAILIWLRRRDAMRFGWEGAAWTAALVLVVVLGVSGNLRHQRGLYEDYRWRVQAAKDVYLSAGPVADGESILYVAMRRAGYQSAVQTGDATRFSAASADDVLGVTAAGGRRWVERAGATSAIVPEGALGEAIAQAESPVASFDGRWLAYLREDHGRGSIWVRAAGQTAERPVTPPELNAMEMSFLPDGELVFSAVSGGQPGLFTTGQGGGVRSLAAGEARYPAVSPDGRWLAFSQLDRGNWNLWLRDLASGEQQRLTHAECNDMQPSWAADSKTLVYASDCGRALWFGEICRRRVAPE